MKKLKPKATKAKPKRKPREWTAYVIQSSEFDSKGSFVGGLYKTKADAERVGALTFRYWGLEVIKVKVTEVVE